MLHRHAPKPSSIRAQPLMVLKFVAAHAGDCGHPCDMVFLRAHVSAGIVCWVEEESI